jgi:hypothetical protein
MCNCLLLWEISIYYNYESNQQDPNILIYYLHFIRPDVFHIQRKYNEFQLIQDTSRQQPG